jgi:hypothetical protein
VQRHALRRAITDAGQTFQGLLELLEGGRHGTDRDGAVRASALRTCRASGRRR